MGEISHSHSRACQCSAVDGAARVCPSAAAGNASCCAAREADPLQGSSQCGLRLQAGMSGYANKLQRSWRNRSPSRLEI